MRTAAAVIAALFWSIHPLRVESVAWATERRDVLSGLFWLAALLTYVATFPPGTQSPRSADGLRCRSSSSCFRCSPKAWGMTFFVGRGDSRLVPAAPTPESPLPLAVA
jgi:hypothetical protein